MISFHKNPDPYMASLTGALEALPPEEDERPEPPGDSVVLSALALAHLEDDF